MRDVVHSLHFTGV